MLVTSAVECTKCKEALKLFEDFTYEVDGVVKVCPFELFIVDIRTRLPENH
jgi:hypothetical protein